MEVTEANFQCSFRKSNPPSEKAANHFDGVLCKATYVVTAVSRFGQIYVNRFYLFWQCSVRRNCRHLKCTKILREPFPDKICIIYLIQSHGEKCILFNVCILRHRLKKRILLHRVDRHFIEHISFQEYLRNSNHKWHLLRQKFHTMAVFDPGEGTRVRTPCEISQTI